MVMLMSPARSRVRIEAAWQPSRGAGRPRRSPSTESRRYGGLGLAGGGRRATGTLGAADSQQAGHADKVRRLHIPPPHRCGSALNCAALIGLRVPALHVLGGPAPRHLRHTVTRVATPSSPTSFARLVRNPTLIVASAARGSLIASPSRQHAQGLSEDTPSFRQRLHCKYRDACEFEEKAMKVVASVESYLKAMSGFGELTECQSQRQPFLPRLTARSGDVRRYQGSVA